MSNLARLYAARGEQALAELYRERIRSHQQRNPYYHYHVASRALARAYEYATFPDIRTTYERKLEAFN